MDGIISNTRYVNTSKLDDIKYKLQSIIDGKRIADLDPVIADVIQQVREILALEHYTKAEITDIIANRAGFEKVDSLPSANISPNKIYLVKIVNDDNSSDTDAYDEYIYTDDHWEHLGSFQADFSNYYTKAEIPPLLDGRVETITNEFTSVKTGFTELQNYVGNINAVLDAINGEVV